MLRCSRVVWDMLLGRRRPGLGRYVRQEEEETVFRRCDGRSGCKVGICRGGSERGCGWGEARYTCRTWQGPRNGDTKAKEKDDKGKEETPTESEFFTQSVSILKPKPTRCRGAKKYVVSGRGRYTPKCKCKSPGGDDGGDRRRHGADREVGPPSTAPVASSLQATR